MMYHNSHFFFDNSQTNNSQKVIFSDIHQLNLAISKISNTIDESGFSPKFNSHFKLSNQQVNTWSQAWVAINIDILLDGNILATIHKADVIVNNELDVQFQQILPRFGINEQQLEIQVTPIGWMPTYPLHINAAIPSVTESLLESPPIKVATAK